MKTSAEKCVLSTYCLQHELPEFPVYQGHITEEATENCTQNVRNSNIHCKNFVTFKSLLLYMSLKVIF